MSDNPPRTPDHEIDPVFLERWSPRAFNGEAVPEAALMQMFEAMRWTPSAYNSQPWRVVYALRDTPNWLPLLRLLVPFNQAWAGNAGALVCFISKSTMVPPGKTDAVPSYSHSFDAGAGWFAFTMQAHTLGYITHGMTGFDMDGAFAALGVPEGYRVEMMAAVGRQGDKSVLPEAAQAREFPNGREKVETFAFEGSFKR